MTIISITLSNFDIFTCSETLMTSDKIGLQSDELKDFCTIHAPGLKVKKKGRPSSGITTFIRKNLQKRLVILEKNSMYG
jgi:hypothetical protein